MDAIIGRYRVSTETDQLILKHGAGISFALTPKEALALADLINVYRQTLITLQDELEQQTIPYLPDRDEKHNVRHLDSRHPPHASE